MERHTDKQYRVILMVAISSLEQVKAKASLPQSTQKHKRIPETYFQDKMHKRIMSSSS
jgi:hypothetical protein